MLAWSLQIGPVLVKFMIYSFSKVFKILKISQNIHSEIFGIFTNFKVPENALNYLNFAEKKKKKSTSEFFYLNHP